MKPGKYTGLNVRQATTVVVVPGHSFLPPLFGSWVHAADRISRARTPESPYAHTGFIDKWPPIVPIRYRTTNRFVKPDELSRLSFDRRNSFLSGELKCAIGLSPSRSPWSC